MITWLHFWLFTFQWDLMDKVFGVLIENFQAEWIKLHRLLQCFLNPWRGLLDMFILLQNWAFNFLHFLLEFLNGGQLLIRLWTWNLIEYMQNSFVLRFQLKNLNFHKSVWVWVLLHFLWVFYFVQWPYEWMCECINPIIELLPHLH